MKRKHWIDIARGISIILIVYGHSVVIGNKIYMYLYSFNVPVFFFISGLTFCNNGKLDNYGFDDRPFLNFVDKTIKKLIYPYFIWGGISILIYNFMARITIVSLGYKKEIYTLKQCFWGLFYGNVRNGYMDWNRPLWFLPCIVIVEVIVFLLCKIGKKYGCMKFILNASMVISINWIFIMSFLKKNQKLSLPWELETSISMLSFFIIAVVLRNNEKIRRSYKKIRENNKIIAICFISIVVILNSWVAIYNGYIDVSTDLFENPMLFLICSNMGILTVCVSAIIIESNLWLEYIGRNSMTILVMHKFPVMIFRLLENKLKIDNNNFCAFIVCVITIAVCLILGRLKIVKKMVSL